MARTQEKKSTMQLFAEGDPEAIVEVVQAAEEIAEKAFGKLANLDATSQIVEIMRNVDDVASLGEMLARAQSIAKRAYKNLVDGEPTPEQVFTIFDYLYEEDEDEE